MPSKPTRTAKSPANGMPSSKAKENENGQSQESSAPMLGCYNGTGLRVVMEGKSDGAGSNVEKGKKKQVRHPRLYCQKTSPKKANSTNPSSKKKGEDGDFQATSSSTDTPKKKASRIRREAGFYQKSKVIPTSSDTSGREFRQLCRVLMRAGLIKRDVGCYKPSENPSPGSAEDAPLTLESYQAINSDIKKKAQSAFYDSVPKIKMTENCLAVFHKASSLYAFECVREAQNQTDQQKRTIVTRENVLAAQRILAERGLGPKWGMYLQNVTPSAV